MAAPDPVLCKDLPFRAKVGNPVWCDEVEPFILALLDLTSDPCALMTAFLNSREKITDLNNKIQSEDAPIPTSQTECNFHSWWATVMVFAGSMWSLVDCLDKNGESQFDKFDVHASHGHCFGPHVSIGLGPTITCHDQNGVVTERKTTFISRNTDSISSQMNDFRNALVSICDKPLPPPPPPPEDVDKCCEEVIEKLDALISQAQGVV